MKSARPRILLVGVGRFGKNHLRILQKLAAQKRLTLAGIVVKTAKKKRILEKEGIDIPVFTRLNAPLLRSVDGVDIVTPLESHSRLVRTCLPHTNVFIEKPLAETAPEAARLVSLARLHKRTLMVGHVYRFHPVTQKLRTLLRGRLHASRITGALVSPLATYRGEEPALEMLHFFDVLDTLIGVKPTSVFGRSRSKRLSDVDLRYPHDIDASLEIGWRGKEKTRAMAFTLRDGTTIRADFANNTITIENKKRKQVIRVHEAKEPLEKELDAWVDTICGKKIDYPDGEVGARIVEIAKRALPRERRRVAVIGAGIFGMTAGLSLPKEFDVHVFEAHDTILAGATGTNQFRHHMGYHYPRSPETIREIQDATRDFSGWYGKALIDDFPSYYAVAKKGSLISEKEFKKICATSKLECIEEMPDPSLIDPLSITKSFRTREGIYDTDALRTIIEKKRTRSPHVHLHLNQRVTGAHLTPRGTKKLTISGAHKSVQEFDYVINATYANYNMLADWLHFPKKNLELRYKEVIVVKLPVPRIALTIIDGPFATIVPTAREGVFTFGDVPLSVRGSGSGDKGTDPHERKWRTKKSAWPQMRKRCREWFPILEKAEYIDSFFTVLPVEPSAAATDARPSIVTDHGFGCYSILSGKVITAVSSAKIVRDALSAFTA